MVNPSIRAGGMDEAYKMKIIGPVGKWKSVKKDMSLLPQMDPAFLNWFSDHADEFVDEYPEVIAWKSWVAAKDKNETHSHN